MNTHILRSLSLVTIALLPPTLCAGDNASPPDYTKATPQSLGIEPVQPHKDARTGFVVGGKNPTDSLAKLPTIAGRKIAALEKDMRPGAASNKGFLGKDERLLDVLTADNRYVADELGLDHQLLARHLHVVGAIAVKLAQKEQREIAYHGKRFRLQAACARGHQPSPFLDDTEANCNVTVTNLGNGKKLTYSLLVPHMIERYGFYEGKGTPYRLEPRTVLDVFDFIKPAKKPDA